MTKTNKCLAAQKRYPPEAKTHSIEGITSKPYKPIVKHFQPIKKYKTAYEAMKEVCSIVDEYRTNDYRFSEDYIEEVKLVLNSYRVKVK